MDFIAGLKDREARRAKMEPAGKFVKNTTEKIRRRTSPWLYIGALIAVLIGGAIAARPLAVHQGQPTDIVGVVCPGPPSPLVKVERFFADVDGDGDEDIFWCGWVLENNNSNPFQPTQTP